MASFDWTVPEVCHWRAGENGRDNWTHTVPDYNGEHDIKHNMSMSSDEDAQVLEENGDFGQS